MQRYKKMKMVIDKNELPIELILQIADKVMHGEMEVVFSKDNGGESTIWADTENAENILIEVVKLGMFKTCVRFPKLFAETTNLETEGTLSIKGDKVLVNISPQNINNFEVIVRQQPDGYRVTQGNLEALSYTELKNFIRRYPDLDEELNLSSSQSTLLVETFNHFNITPMEEN